MTTAAIPPDDFFDDGPLPPGGPDDLPPRPRQLQRGDHVEFAGLLLERVQGDGEPPIHDEGGLYTYEAGTGLWKDVDETAQSKIVQSFAGCSVVGSQLAQKIRAGDVSGTMKLAGHLAASPGFFADAPKGLVFRNGFVQVTAERVTTLAHSPDHRARYGYPFEYDPAVPRMWLAFLRSLFANDDDREERIAFVQEYFGACLVGIAPTYAKCLVAVGAGENGKSRMGEILTEAFPPGSCTVVPPQLFANEYRRAMLARKLLNFVAELPEAEILDSEAFKAIVAGDMIQGRPPYGHPFDFKPCAGHYFAANRLPGSKDTSHAFWRRFVVLNFTRTFREGDPDRDPHIHTKIVAAELPAIVAWLLEGASRVMRQGGYSVPSSHAATLAAWKLAADQVALFVHEALLPAASPRPEGNHDWNAAAHVYEAYRRWAEASGHRPPMARNKFGARLEAVGYPSVKTKHGWFYGQPCEAGDER